MKTSRWRTCRSFADKNARASMGLQGEQEEEAQEGEVCRAGVSEQGPSVVGSRHARFNLWFRNRFQAKRRLGFPIHQCQAGVVPVPQPLGPELLAHKQTQRSRSSNGRGSRGHPQPEIAISQEGRGTVRQELALAFPHTTQI